MDKRYIDLLIKYCKDKDLRELLDLVYLDALRESEETYLVRGQYPDRRDALGKLKIDLLTVAETRKG